MTRILPMAGGASYSEELSVGSLSVTIPQDILLRSWGRGSWRWSDKRWWRDMVAGGTGLVFVESWHLQSPAGVVSNPASRIRALGYNRGCWELTCGRRFGHRRPADTWPLSPGIRVFLLPRREQPCCPSYNRNWVLEPCNMFGRHSSGHEIKSCFYLSLLNDGTNMSHALQVELHS